MDRAYQLTGLPAGFTPVPYLPIILDVVIGILAIIVAYLLFIKVSSFFSTPIAIEETMMSAGKRR